MLERFNRWFTSAAGVWQTCAVTLVIVVLERVFPHADPHGFWLLYILTVYSGVTQSALAYAGAQSADKLDRALAKIERLEEQILAVETRLADRIESKGTT